MEARACLKYIRVTPRKLRLLANAARGKKVEQAINALRFSEKNMAGPVVKLIRSAVSNATQDRKIDIDQLYVKKIFVDPAPTMKRMMPRARGSGARILKHTSHLTVVVGSGAEKQIEEKVKTKEMKTETKKTQKEKKE